MRFPDLTFGQYGPTRYPSSYVSAVSSTRSKYIDGGYPKYEVTMEVYDPDEVRRLEEYARCGYLPVADNDARVEADKLREEVYQLRGRVDDRDKLQAEVESLRAELDALKTSSKKTRHNYCGTVAGLLDYLEVETTLPPSLHGVSVIASWSQVARDDLPVEEKKFFDPSPPATPPNYSNILVENIHLTAENGIYTWIGAAVGPQSSAECAGGQQ